MGAPLSTPWVARTWPSNWWVAATQISQPGRCNASARSWWPSGNSWNKPLTPRSDAKAVFRNTYLINNSKIKSRRKSHIKEFLNITARTKSGAIVCTDICSNNNRTGKSEMKCRDNEGKCYHRQQLYSLISNHLRFFVFRIFWGNDDILHLSPPNNTPTITPQL